MTETPWQRLSRIVEARRIALALTQEGVHAVGGPSKSWLGNLKHLQGEPSGRHVAALTKLDAALRWPEGTSFGLVHDDRSEWAPQILEDEERQLVEQKDEADHFAYVVAARIRALPNGERRQVMRRVLRELGLPFQD